MREVIALERVAQEVFAFFVLVELHLRINGHDVFDEIEVAERNAGFERVGGDAAIGAEHIVHMKLPHALLRLPFWNAAALGAKSVYL